jgi:putative dimethyl sulfoxide reductase chaperone
MVMYSQSDSAIDDEIGPTYFELAASRYGVYRILASVFLPPTTERIAELSGIASEVIEDPTLTQFSFYPVWKQLLQGLIILEATPFNDTRSLFDAAFTSGTGAAGGAPRESRFQEPTEQGNGAVEADLSRRYSNAGLNIGTNSPVPADHITVQLEYLAVLCENEALSWEAGDTATALRAMRLGRAFLRKHLTWWLPRLEHQVEATVPGSIYTVAARTATDFTVHERDLFDLILDLSSRPARAGGQG